MPAFGEMRQWARAATHACFFVEVGILVFSALIDRSPHQNLAPSRTRHLPFLTVLALFACLCFAGCAQQPKSLTVSHGKEYFPSSVYGPASKRVIADGQPVPRGGGQYLVGKPYTIAGRTYVPTERRTTQVGYASWYGDAFHGRLTANGEIYDRDGFTAASPTMPLPSYARVTNLRNNYSMIVRVNDRGPYASDRIMDVSRRVAEALDYKRYGTTKLKVEYVGRASLAGSDDSKLYATLRTDRPAPWQTQPVLLAAAAPRTRTAAAAPDTSESDGSVEEREMPRRETRVLQRDPAREGTIEARRAEKQWKTTPDRQDLRGSDDYARHRFTEYREDKNQASLRRFARNDWNEERQYGSRDATAPFQTRRDEPTPPRRPSRTVGKVVQMPPSRPMDLGTIPGAASQIRAHRDGQGFRVARSHYD